MSKQSVIQPWKATCELRSDIRNRTLTASDFAVDLYKVIHGWPGAVPYYCDPLQFFGTTYATQNLRQFCKVVLRRLAKLPGGEAIINVAQTFGGGKSHTLTVLYYLTTLGAKLPKQETSVTTCLVTCPKILRFAPKGRLRVERPVLSPMPLGMMGRRRRTTIFWRLTRIALAELLRE